MGVAPAQVGVHGAGQDDMVGVVGVADREACAAARTAASIGSAQEALVGVRHNSTLCRAAQARIAGVLFADRLSRMT